MRRLIAYGGGWLMFIGLLYINQFHRGPSGQTAHFHTQVVSGFIVAHLVVLAVWGAFMLAKHFEKEDSP